MRQLDAHGFVTEDAGPVDKHARERWWRAAHGGTWLEDLPDDPAILATTQAYLRAVAHANARRVESWLDEMDTAPKHWRDVATVSDLTRRLTAEEAAQLGDRLGALLAEYRRHEPGTDGPPGAAPVAVQWQILPELEAGGTGSDGGPA